VARRAGGCPKKQGDCSSVEKIAPFAHEGGGSQSRGLSKKQGTVYLLYNKFTID